ncbi:hypothetical protein GCM10007978_30220 [Shewanella hanedai]|uniref:DUF6438 domain-containing protein n=1 Tax=Shewanella hanedai TaxID=25 RepID=A0A553JKG0_SHEHA|nr:DUF6438 domain-containing protein [Shewanella hanedai]TRY12940.1 hypothetical protein FN961_17710 [Shewanella hanedai]GGI90551.1 hypothetical protein GCM10007978_30220 [Shewanella hanedai]
MRKYLLMLISISFFHVSAQDLATLHKESGASLPSYFDKSEFQSYEFKTFGITEIGLQKTSCFGRCPTFLLNIKMDGSVYYEGHNFVEKMGIYTGKLEKYQLINILAYIDQIAFMDFQDVYSYDVTDHSSIYTMVKTNSEQKIIKNYANTGPSKLWALEQLMTQLLTEVKWDKE